VQGCAGWRFVVEELIAVGVHAHLAYPAETAGLRRRGRCVASTTLPSRSSCCEHNGGFRPTTSPCRALRARHYRVGWLCGRSSGPRAVRCADSLILSSWCATHGWMSPCTPRPTNAPRAPVPAGLTGAAVGGVRGPAQPVFSLSTIIWFRSALAAGVPGWRHDRRRRPGTVVRAPRAPDRRATPPEARSWLNSLLSF
jgi:hypothetical protein